MKQHVSIPHLVGAPTKATIVIDKNGMSVLDKNEPCSDSSVIKGFLTQLVDLDEWNHSWHMSVSNAQFKSSEERRRVREILKDKIKQREDEIEKLKNGIQILGRWNINTN